MQYCRICGNPLEDNQTLCPLCGAPINKQRDMRAGVASLFASPQPAAAAPAQQPQAEPAAPLQAKPQELSEPKASSGPAVSGAPQQEPAAADPALADPAIAQALSDFLSSVENGAQPQTPPAAQEETAAESTAENAAANDIEAAQEEAQPAEAETAPDTADEAGEAPSHKEAAVKRKKEEKAAKKAAKRAEKAAAAAAKRSKTQQTETQDDSALLRTTGLGKGGVLLMLLLSIAAIAAAVAMIVLPLLQQREAEQQDRTDAYLNHLCGSWLSEPFTYAGDETLTPIREMLLLKDDYTFSSTNYSSPNDRDSFDPVTWTVSDVTAGSWALELETASIRFYYQREDGSTYVYRRYIRDLTAQGLVLREYYNEQMTDYYDVAFIPAEG